MDVDDVGIIAKERSSAVERPADNREVMSSNLIVPMQRACSSVGRASALQAGGQRFKPFHAH